MGKIGQIELTNSLYFALFFVIYLDEFNDFNNYIVNVLSFYIVCAFPLYTQEKAGILNFSRAVLRCASFWLILYQPFRGAAPLATDRWSQSPRSIVNDVTF